MSACRSVTNSAHVLVGIYIYICMLFDKTLLLRLIVDFLDNKEIQQAVENLHACTCMGCSRLSICCVQHVAGLQEIYATSRSKWSLVQRRRMRQKKTA